MELILIIFLVTVYNVLYIKLNKKRSIFFFNYFCFFLIYTLILGIYDFIFINYLIFSDIIVILIIIYFLIFISSFLTIGLYYMDSPTNLILNFLIKNKKVKKISIIKMLKREKIIGNRFKDLEKQKLIEIDKKQIIHLSSLGLKSGYFFDLVRKIFKIKVEG